MCRTEKFWNSSFSSLLMTLSLEASDFRFTNSCSRLFRKFSVSPIDLMIDRLDLLI